MVMIGARKGRPRLRGGFMAILYLAEVCNQPAMLSIHTL
jgi:hypothetical protein